MFKEEVLRKLIRKSLEEKSKNGSKPDNVSGDAEQNGNVWVEKGKIYVRNRQQKRKPTITPCKHATLYINKMPVYEQVAVDENNEIFVETECEETPGEITVSVSPDKLKAFIKISPVTKICYRLVDQNAQEDLFLKVNPFVEQYWNISADSIKKELARNNVVYGINYDLIDDLVKNPRLAEELVASGSEPQAPADDRVEIYFAGTIPGKPKILPDGSVDFRTLNRFPPSVEQETILARRFPGTKGIPGKDVNGRLIPPANQKHLFLKGGKGVAIDTEKQEVKAVISGHPVAKITGNVYWFDVLPVLVQHGNVDLASGNIQFKGDIKVLGDVKAGMVIASTGKTEINGAVYEATINTGGDVLVRNNVINTKIKAGGHERYYTKFLPLLRELKNKLRELTEVLNFLTHHRFFEKQELNFGQLLLVLEEMKFKEIPIFINRLKELERNADFELHQELIHFINLMVNTFTGLNPLKLKKITEIMMFFPQLDLLEKLLLENTAEKACAILLSYTLNSKITASGSVLVSGAGCYNSFIDAGGDVNIRGVMRGGEIISEGNVTVGTAGSDIGISTIIRVPAGKSIKINHACPGVHLQVGRAFKELSQSEQQISTTVNEKGELGLS